MNFNALNIDLDIKHISIINLCCRSLSSRKLTASGFVGFDKYFTKSVKILAICFKILIYGYGYAKHIHILNVLTVECCFFILPLRL